MSKYGNIFNFVTWLAKSKNASGSIFEVGFSYSFPRVLNQLPTSKHHAPIFPVFFCSFDFSPKALLGHLDVRLCITDSRFKNLHCPRYFRHGFKEQAHVMLKCCFHLIQTPLRKFMVNRNDVNLMIRSVIVLLVMALVRDGEVMVINNEALGN